MDAYQLKDTLRLTVPAELGGERVVSFAKAELAVKTWRSAPYGYGRDEWVPETLVVWIHSETGTLTVDPTGFVGGRVLAEERS